MTNKLWLWFFCHLPRLICLFDGHTWDHTYGTPATRCLVCGRKK